MGSLDLYRAHPHLSATLQPASSLGTNLTRGDSRLSRDRSHAQKRYTRRCPERSFRENERVSRPAPRDHRGAVCITLERVHTHARSHSHTVTLTHPQLETRRSHGFRSSLVLVDAARSPSRRAFLHDACYDCDHCEPFHLDRQREHVAGGATVNAAQCTVV